MTGTDRHRQDAPAARRNRDAILAALSEFLPQAGAALEIAGGTGQHVVAFAGASPDVTWQPSDPDPWARASIAAWTRSTGVGNVHPPADLDVTQADWHAALRQSFDLIVCINLLHVVPWVACEGLMAGAARLLKPGGHLFIYGCFKRNGRHMAESNERFDRFLVFQDPEWGVRDLEAVVACARAQGLTHARTVDMPANNLSVIFRRDQAPPR
jgi:SAM-dependent methyltransferase